MQVRRRRKKKRRGWVGKRKRQDACVSGREPGGRFSLMAPHCRSRGAALFVHQQHPSSQGHTKQEKKTKQKKTKATSKRAFPRIDFICFLVSLSAGHSGSTTRCCGEEKKNRVRYRTRYLSAIDSSSLRIVYVRLRLVSRKDVG